MGTAFSREKLRRRIAASIAARVDVACEPEERVGHRSRLTIGLNPERDHTGENLRAARKLFQAKQRDRCRLQIVPCMRLKSDSKLVLGSRYQASASSSGGSTVRAGSPFSRTWAAISLMARPDGFTVPS